MLVTSLQKGHTMKKLLIKLLAIITFCVGASFAMADEASDLHGLQTRWAEIKYNTAVAEKEKAFFTLIGDAEKLSAAHQSAPFLIWEGIIRSTYAGVKGGLGALDQVKHAKKLFEQSIALQPDALNGAAYTSLGSLYYQVPGWPVGFRHRMRGRAAAAWQTPHAPRWLRRSRRWQCRRIRQSCTRARADAPGVSPEQRRRSVPSGRPCP